MSSFSKLVPVYQYIVINFSPSISPLRINSLSWPLLIPKWPLFQPVTSRAPLSLSETGIQLASISPKKASPSSSSKWRTTTAATAADLYQHPGPLVPTTRPNCGSGGPIQPVSAGKNWPINQYLLGTSRTNLLELSYRSIAH